jgi:hypothetical protein
MRGQCGDIGKQVLGQHCGLQPGGDRFGQSWCQVRGQGLGITVQGQNAAAPAVEVMNPGYKPREN